MGILSAESARILEFLESSGEVPEDKLPEGYAMDLLPHLVSSRLVKKVSILAPSAEPEYPHGLWAYQIDSAGIEVLNQFRDEAKKEAKENSQQKRRAFWGAVKFWVGLILGWVLGGFTPKEVFGWIRSLFQ